MKPQLHKILSSPGPQFKQEASKAFNVALTQLTFLIRSRRLSSPLRITVDTIRAKEWFKTVTKEEKTEIPLTMGTEFKLIDKKLEIIWQKPLELIKETVWLEPLRIEPKITKNRVNVEFKKGSGLVPSNNVVMTREKEIQESEILLWRGKPVSNLRPFPSYIFPSIN